MLAEKSLLLIDQRDIVLPSIVRRAVEVIALIVKSLNVVGQFQLSSSAAIGHKGAKFREINPFYMVNFIFADFQIGKLLFLNFHQTCKVGVKRSVNVA